MPKALDSLLAALQRLRLPATARPAVACSGGADSMTLLAAARRLWPTLQVLHVDHGTRGAESAADARFVLGTCRALGLNCHLAQLHVAAGPGFEARARAARYAAFEQLAQREGLTHLLLAHHADDQAETVALRQERGSGPRGLRGMPTTRKLTTTSTVRIVRPFLHLSRATLRAAQAELGVDHREDPTNAQAIGRRNVLRAKLQTEPRRIAQLQATARTASRTFAAHERAARKLLPATAILSHAGMRFAPLRILQAAPTALHASLLLRLLPDTCALSRAAIAEFARLLHCDQGAADLGNGTRLMVFGDHMIVRTAAVPGFDAITLRDPQHPPGHVNTPLGPLAMRFLSSDAAVQRALQRCQWDSGSCILSVPPLSIAPPRTAQRYRPLGAPGSKLLSDALREHRIPTELRALWPVCSDAEGVLWAPGIVPAARARVERAPGWQVCSLGLLRKLCDPQSVGQKH